MELKKAKEIIKGFVENQIKDHISCFGGDSLYNDETMEDIMEAFELIKEFLENGA